MILPSLRLRFDVFFLVAADERRLSEENQGVANMMKMSHTGKWMIWVFERMTSLKHNNGNIMKKHNVNNRRKVALAQREKDLNELNRQEREKDYKRIVEEVKTLQNRITLSTTEQRN